MTKTNAPFDCALCGRRIGKRRSHYVLTDHRVVCARCLHRHRLYDAKMPGSYTRAAVAVELAEQVHR